MKTLSRTTDIRGEVVKSVSKSEAELLAAAGHDARLFEPCNNFI